MTTQDAPVRCALVRAKPNGWRSVGTWGWRENAVEYFRLDLHEAKVSDLRTELAQMDAALTAARGEIARLRTLVDALREKLERARL